MCSDPKQDPIKGGFGGGPKQLPHCAPMYASVLSLLIVGTPEAYDVIDRCVFCGYRIITMLCVFCNSWRVLFCVVIQNFIVCRRATTSGNRGRFDIYPYEKLKDKRLGCWRDPFEIRVGDFIFRPLVVDLVTSSCW